MFNKIYLGLGSALIGFYGLASFNGWELGQPRQQVVPASERKPGWSRTHTYAHYHTGYWYSGYRGGK